ncbi:uncharacterized protein LOC105828966 isoform X2 [Monomorium pharaonis]|uniref:uncharacterized protein LOC105828966 isoform X2 n=1 Tax=Monomorium pharaonis TaxID=307658 RepID=UPI00174617B3|nr:uncharacterized protein LOC105828966 isoform X2 [Monomorium pharaonis]
MSSFLKDSIRREKWRMNCINLREMKGFTPGNSAVLCKYHFAADMWEKLSADGKKKLKNNAVPTIFGDLVQQISTTCSGFKVINYQIAVKYF